MEKEEEVKVEEKIEYHILFVTAVILIVKVINIIINCNAYSIALFIHVLYNENMCINMTLNQTCTNETLFVHARK